MPTGKGLGRPIEILLVEDSESDADLTREALKRGIVPSKVNHVEDGVAAMHYLRRTGPFPDAVRPDVMLLDLNLPGKDGRQLLKEIREDQELSELPVIVLTTSTDEDDIVQAYGLHASCYVAKPVDVNQFFAVIRSLEEFWLTRVQLPSPRST